VYVHVKINDDKSMLPPAGPEAEESPLRLLYSKIYCTIHIMQKKQERHRTHKSSDIEIYILLLVEKIEERCLLGFVVYDIY
jgi:hypothetical protein